MSSNNKCIYLAFYVYALDSSTCFSPLNKLIDICTGPFTHVQLCYEEQKDVKWPLVRALNITNESDGIKKGICKMDRPGYVFIKVPMTSQELKALMRAESKLLNHKTYLDRLSMITGSANGRLTGEETGWFCSQMINFLLVECGWLDDSPDNSPSVTGLYLKIKRKAELFRKVDIELKYNPFKPSIRIPSCLEVYHGVESSSENSTLA